MTNQKMSEVWSEIPDAGTWNTVEEIHKGWSKDRKYYIATKDGRELLLRLSDLSQYDRKQREFIAVKKLDAEDILMSRPLACGLCNNGQSVYSLFTWIGGQDANQAIPALSAAEQYRLGVQAGKALRKIHAIPADSGQMPWGERYNGKIDKNIANYKVCAITLKGAEKIIGFIERNRCLLDDRPQSFQHGDYHVGNMVITSSHELGIIDFNRLDYGDPWEEFNRITWDARLSALFASGRIHGYFNNDVPDAFFRLMALYIANNQISSIHWAIPFGREQVEIMLEQAGDVLNWYDGFQTCVPGWYLPSY